MLGKHAQRLKLARFVSFKSAASPGRVIFLCPILILVGVLGCAAPPIVPIDASGPIELAPNEALLIIHVDTDFALENLALNSHPLVQFLGRGRHIWMVRAPEGRYCWKQIEVGSQPRNRLKHSPEPDEELCFAVQAGKINYPGELIIRSSPISRSGGEAPLVRNQNHSAMAVRELRGSYDSILRSLPIRYARPGRDDFLEYYMRKRELPTAGPSGAANRESCAEAQSEAP